MEPLPIAQDFLRMWARLDLQSERNDRVRYPDGAYIDIEHHLLRLALVSEIVPRANKKYVVATPPAKASLPASALEPTPTANSSSVAASEKKKHSAAMTGSAETSSSALTGAAASDSGAKDKKSKSKFALFGLAKEKDKDDKKANKIQKKMAKGTGYSSYQQKGWDPKAYMAAQREKDKQIELVLGKIHQELRKLHGPGQERSQGGEATSEDDEATSSSSTSATATRNSSVATACGRGGSRRKRKHSPDEIAAAAAAEQSQPHDGGGACATVPSSAASSPIDPQSDLFAVLEGSALVPFLESKLQANSFLEICSHKNVYQCVVNIVREVAGQPYLVSLLGQLPDQTTSLHSLLLALETQARVLLDKIGKASANGSVPRSAAAGPAVGGVGGVGAAGGGSGGGSGGGFSGSSASGTGGASGPAGTSGAGSSSGATAKIVDKLNEKASDDKLAREFLALSREVTQALKNASLLSGMNGESHSSPANLSSAASKGASAASNDVHMDSTGSDDTDGSSADAAPDGAGASTASNPSPGPSGAQQELRRKTREDKSSELYRKHMRTLQFDSAEFSLAGSQVWGADQFW